MHLALRQFRPLLQGIGPHGQTLRLSRTSTGRRSTITPYVTARPPSRPLESDAAQIAVCRPHSRGAQLCSRRALTTAHVPWRMATPSQDNPADLESIQGSSGGPVSSHDSSHCQLYYSLTEAPLGTDTRASQLASGSMQVLYVFPPVSLLAQTLCKVRRTKSCSSRQPSSLAYPPETGPSLSGARHHLADLNDLSPAVVNTITQARAPSMRQPTL